MTRTDPTAASGPIVGRRSSRVSGCLKNESRRGAEHGRGRTAALALAVSLVPVVAQAEGFWQAPSEAEPAPRIARAFPLEVVGLRPSMDEQMSRLTKDKDEPAAMITMPGVSSRLGIAVSRDSGRPRFSGLAYQATPSLRISADGGWDFDEGSVSGGVKFRFAF